MPAPRKLKPATKKLLAAYGARRPCLRYRCDPVSQTIVKTVEIIVEESVRTPPTSRIAAETIIGVCVRLRETALQHQIRKAGGRWNRSRGLWEMQRDQAVTLGLSKRIER